MTLVFDGYPQKYEIEALCRSFYPYRKMRFLYEYQGRIEDDIVLYLRLKPVLSGLHFLVVMVSHTVTTAAHITRSARDLPRKEIDRQFCLLLFPLLQNASGIRPKWGILTGIRPVKLIHRYRNEGKTDPQIIRLLQKDYLVSPEKAELSMMTADHEIRVIESSHTNSFSLYVAIPFCPSRCSYCSFVSQSVERLAQDIPAYLHLLCRELSEIGKLTKKLSLRLETVYIGGGTPTTLSAKQLQHLFEVIASSFDLSHLREYTVEAGRPDTITEAKLCAIRDAGIERISINPQTFSDSVLRTIGRRHTAQDVLDAYMLARSVGFSCINMDLIAGLPGDTPEGFSKTLDTALSLSPENITVHTLTLKRSSTLYQENRQQFSSGEGETAKMLTLSRERLLANGYRPYYMYRQKNTLESLENVGYAKPGYEGLYNVFIMDETHSILAAGASAVTKLVEPGGKIERIFNFKYPDEYRRRFDEILNRKGEIMSFYETYLS